MKSCPTCSALCHDRARFCPSCGGNVEEAAATDADPYLGLTLAEKYQIKELIGEGGMGKVYRAEHLALERPVAVKILHQHLIGDETSVARFVAEAREASRLNHPHIVSVIEFGETDYGVMFLVMEFLRGRPLTDIIATEYPMPFGRVAAIFRQILLAVGEAHKRGVLHRDLKPDNVFIESLADGSERVKVIDFGIAKRFDLEPEGLTAPGMVCGTPEYMSPEQVQGEPLDPRSDVYSLGILLYEMIVGSPPFFGGGAAEIMVQHADADPLPPSEAAAEQDIPDSLDAIVLWALAKDRNSRVGSVVELRRVLDSWLLVSNRTDAAVEDIVGTTCPSCNSFYLEDANVCPACGYRLPLDQPQEGAQFLIDSLGEEQFERLREEEARYTGATVNARSRAAAHPLKTELLVRSDEAIPQYLPLCGREHELETLLRCLEVGGPHRLVGEAGLGKSRLFDELSSRARDAGFDVIRVAPRDEMHWPCPLWPIRQIAAELMGCTQETCSDRDSLLEQLDRVGLGRDTLPGMAELFGMPQPPQKRMDRVARRREAYAALQELLLARADRKPLALLIEDVDQMDAPSRRFVAYLQSLPIQQSLLTVVCLDRLPDEHDGIPTVELSGLDRQDALALVELKQGGKPLAAEAGELLDLAGGNPFFIDQLVRLMHEGGLPEFLARRIELLDARLDRLPLHLRELLQRIAVHGGRVPIQRIERAFGLDAEALDDHLNLLERFGLVKTGLDWVSTSHPLLEDAVQAGMPAEIRSEAHRRFLATLSLNPRTIGAAVRHALGGGDDRTATEILTMGAGVAYSLHDNGRAVQWLQLAFQKSRMLWGRGELGMAVDTRITVEIGRVLAEILSQDGDRKMAEAVLREIRQFASAEQPSLAAAVLMDQARQARSRGQLSSSAELLNEALELAMREGDGESWLTYELLFLQGELASQRGQKNRALSTFAEGVALSERLDLAGNDQAWRFQLGLGELRRGQDLPEEAEEYLNHAVLAAEESGSLVGLLKVQVVFSDLLLRQGKVVRARDHLGDAARCAQQIGDRSMAAQLTLQIGQLAMHTSDDAAAADYFRQAVAWSRAVGRVNVSREATRFLKELGKRSAASQG